MAISTPPGTPSQPSSHKNNCPICGNLKTGWSAKCSDCESNRQRYLASASRADSDRAFLAAVEGRNMAEVGRERGISRERVRQLIADAKRRIDFLNQNPIPPMVIRDTTTVH